jgi:hypothetical protein
MDPKTAPVTRGESLNVLSWFLLCLTILSKLARFGSKYVIVRKFEWDDFMASLALVRHPTAPPEITHTADRSEVIQCWADHCHVYGDRKWAWLSHIDVEHF